MLELLKHKIEEAQGTFNQASDALTFRRKAGLVPDLMFHVKAAKDLAKWYQRRGKSCRRANEIRNEAQAQLDHHKGVNQMLKNRRQAAAEELHKLKKLLALVEAGASNDG